MRQGNFWLALKTATDSNTDCFFLLSVALTLYIKKEKMWESIQTKLGLSVMNSELPHDGINKSQQLMYELQSVEVDLLASVVAKRKVWVELD